MKRYFGFTFHGQGHSSADSMPLGGGSLGANVWIQDGQIMLYACESGCFDENGTLLKLGRVRIIPDKPIISDKVIQELIADEGKIIIRDEGWNAEIWADPDSACLHFSFNGFPVKLHFVYDQWRYRNRLIAAEDLGQCRDNIIFGNGITYADTVNPHDERILFYHCCKEKTVFDKLMQQQGLTDIASKYNNILENRIFGGALLVPGTKYIGSSETEYAGVDQRSHLLEGQTSRCAWTMTLTALSGQFSEESIWEQKLAAREAAPVDKDSAAAWWRHRFENSYIVIDPDKNGLESTDIGRNYTLFRYMQLCNSCGDFPTKFNGGLFTFDEGHTPDYRNWGGTCYTGQNQRLVYWPMLKNGDFDLMKSQFDFYKNITEGQKALTSRELKHGGAFYDEQITVFGTACAAEYEVPAKGRRSEVPVWDQDNIWVRLHFSTALEFSFMILEYHRYTGEDISEYVNFIDSAVRFYWEHYPKDETGRLCIYPSTALETYKGNDLSSPIAEEYGCTNPMDAVSGLRAVLKSLVALGFDARGEYAHWLENCPSLPIGIRHGHEMFLPAEKYGLPPNNCELPQLYRVYPFSLSDGISDREKALGIATWQHGIDTDDQRLICSWHQNGIFTARLGLLDDSVELLKQKMCNAPKRFPAFWGPGHDWTPDHNHGGSGAIQLQEMLMNTDGCQITLFPCWPREWDVHFRLYAPNGGIIEAEQKNGERRLISALHNNTLITIGE